MSGLRLCSRVVICFLFATLFVAANARSTSPKMNEIAEQYVRLVLAVGQHDEGYVDAYYGPEEWRPDADDQRSLEQIGSDARLLLDELAAIEAPIDSDSLESLRHRYLQKQLEALSVYVDQLGGESLSFDAESAALYDATAPHLGPEYFEAILEEIDRLMPGDEPLAERVDAYRQRFAIPADRLRVVFAAAVDECRRRTLEFIGLPDDESFRIEYVTDKPWSGYNWYQGGAHSLIQINTDLPIFIERAIDLGCHEGYPGHHTYNALLESHLVQEHGWVEFSVYPLFSPQSLIAEGSANYGIDIAFPGEERLEFMRDVLFPMSGLDPDEAEKYYRLDELIDRLGYSGNEAARAYLDGRMDRAEAIDWLVKYQLWSEERSAQRVDFIETYRAYVINYNVGKDLVRDYVERNAGDDTEKRWEVFSALLASPRLPSDLR